MVKEEKVKVSALILFVLILSLVNITNSCALKDDVLYSAVIDSDYNVTNFSDFEQTNDHSNISSTKTNSQIIFIFDGTFYTHITSERYTQTLPDSFQDFSIRLRLDYHMSSASEGMISYMKVFAGGQSLVEAGILDSWASSQGKYYINAWPNGVSDAKEASSNPAGLSGAVIIEIYRMNNFVNVSIMDQEATTVLFSHTWSSGLSAAVDSFAVTMRTNYDAVSMTAVFAELTAQFSYDNLGTIETTSANGSDLWVTLLYIILALVGCGILVLTIVFIRKGLPKERSQKRKFSKQKLEKVTARNDSRIKKETKTMKSIREENLKKIIESYSQISLELMADLLQFKNVLELQKWIMDLPGEKIFYIEGNEVVIPKELKDSSVESQRDLNRIVESLETNRANTCYYCGQPLEQNIDTCPSCKRSILICSVCKLPISFGEEIGQCSLCEAQGHLTHLQEWIKTQGKCPKCLQKIPIEGIIPIEESYEKK